MKAEQNDLKSRNFLIATMGQVNFDILEKNGHILVSGTNGGTYKITKDGHIYKTIVQQRFLRSPVEKQVGFARIQNAGGLPMKDAIATIYMHIVKDSDKFDRDKACGAISIKR